MTKFDNPVPRLSLKEKINAVKILGDIPKPALIFEGESDVYVYSRLLKLSESDVKDFDLVIGQCKTNILNYHDNSLIPFKYIAVLDSDFDIYYNKCREDENLIYTDFYDMENYLTTLEIIDNSLNDLNDVHTRNITAEQLYSKMIESIFGFIVAIKYKLLCLELVNKGVNIPVFPLEDESIKNEKWWDKRNKRVDLDKMKNTLIKFYEEKGIAFDEIVWNSIVAEVKEDYYESEKKIPINVIVKGRRLIEAYYYAFEFYLGTVMNKREGQIFFNDLRKNIDKSTYAKSFMIKIDSKLKQIGA